jgi:hypothetical protein
LSIIIKEVLLGNKEGSAVESFLHPLVLFISWCHAQPSHQKRKHVHPYVHMYSPNAKNKSRAERLFVTTLQEKVARGFPLAGLHIPNAHLKQGSRHPDDKQIDGSSSFDRYLSF